MVTRTRLGLLQERTTQLSKFPVIFIRIERHNTCVYCLNNHITHTISISMHGYNDVSCYTLYKQWQCIIQLLLVGCIIQLLLPIPCWCIKCESYVRIFFRIYTRSCMMLVRHYVIRAVLCAVLRNSSRTRRVRSCCIRDARPSLFIFAVLSAVLRSGFRDTVTPRYP